MDIDIKRKLRDYLSGFVSENKNNLFDKMVDLRTRYVTVVLEDLFHEHNASAVLRTCDCFGVQDVHMIENENSFVLNPDIALGSSKWLSLHHYNNRLDNTKLTFESLKNQGYTVIATTPHNNDCFIDDLKIDKKIALVFGTEKQGLSDDALKYADGYVKVPMYGFTESLNISVSAALCVFSLTERIRRASIDWRLTEEEKTDIKLQWLRSVIKRSELIESDYLKKILDVYE